MDEPDPRPRVWRHDMHPPHSSECAKPREMTTDHPFEAEHFASFEEALNEANRIGGLIVMEYL